jgi:hypothetical protein
MLREIGSGLSKGWTSSPWPGEGTFGTIDSSSTEETKEVVRRGALSLAGRKELAITVLTGDNRAKRS